MAFEIRSASFEPNGRIPRRHTADGEDLSPALSWSGVPEGTAELLLIVDDPDAPTAQPWVHWVLAGIPASRTSLPEGFHGERVPAGQSNLVQGKNSWGTLGYRGPAPPKGHGVHHYRFRLHALARPLDAARGVEGSQARHAATGQIVGEAEVVGTYER